MNPWPFVIAAYAVMTVVISGLVVWTLAGMRKAERAADELKQR